MTVSEAKPRELRRTVPVERRVALVLANYPNRDGRIANAIRSLLRVMGSRDGRHVELEIVGDD